MVVMLVACAHRPPAAAPPVAAAPHHPVTEPLHVDLSAAFEGNSSASLIDSDRIVPGLLSRVQVSTELLDVSSKDIPIELWTRQALLAYLAHHGSTVLVDPPPVDETALVPTAALHGLRFTAGLDKVPAVVTMGDEAVHVSLRATPDEDSLCPSDLEIPLHYVQLDVAVQRADGAMVGWIHETAIVRTPAEPILELLHAPPTVDPKGFCAALQHQLETAGHLEPAGDNFDMAASNALRGLDLLWTAPERTVPAR